MSHIILSPEETESIVQSAIAHEVEAYKARVLAWSMIRPISAIKQEVFPQRVRVHHATTNYGGTVEKDYRD